MYRAFVNHMTEVRHNDISLHLMSGRPSAGWTLDKDIVLMATPVGFFVDTARETPHTQKLIPKKELFGYDDFQEHLSLTSHCRTVEPKLDDHETPAYNYTVGLESKEARNQMELTQLSIERFGFILIDPETGLTISEEEQDKHVQSIMDSANSRKK